MHPRVERVRILENANRDPRKLCMPFDALTVGDLPDHTLPKSASKVAIIGAGITGLGAARMLAGTHQVTLFEAEPRLGGHARTKMAGKNGDQPVDTGFIVYNEANYPYMTALFEQLQVPVVKSNMSFGASIDGGSFEYALTSLDTLFAQRRNALSPAFLGIGSESPAPRTTYRPASPAASASTLPPVTGIPRNSHASTVPHTGVR